MTRGDAEAGLVADGYQPHHVIARRLLGGRCVPGPERGAALTRAGRANKPAATSAAGNTRLLPTQKIAQRTNSSARCSFEQSARPVGPDDARRLVTVNLGS